MKTRFFTMLTVICAVVSFNVANADVLSLNPDDESNAWGTAYSQVAKHAYYHHIVGEGIVEGNYVKARSWKSDATATTDSWDFRRNLLTEYLREGLGTNKMDDNKVNATSTNPVNYGLLNDKRNGDDTNAGYQRVWEIPYTSKLGYENIYGKKAATLLGNVTTSGVEEAMFRENQTGTIYTSFASPTHSTVEHSWEYTATLDSEGKKVENFSSTASGISNTSNGIGDQSIGIYAFVTGFTYESGTTYQYINGWFAELGTLVGIYVNGVEIPDEYLKLSESFLDSKFFGNFDFEIDLNALYNAGIVKAGNNNLSFIIDSILPEYNYPIGNGNYDSEGNRIYYDGNDGLIAFAAGLNYNSNTIFHDTIPTPDPEPAPTPEPATLLIFGLGLAGLGIRRKLMGKKSA